MDSLQVSLQYVLPWVLACIFVGVGVGYYLGANVRRGAGVEGTIDRQTALKVLSGLLEASEQMSSDVDVHNTEFKQVGQRLLGMRVEGEMEPVHRSMLGEVASVLEANRQLEEDLTYARLRIEEQAQEIDRTRMEARTDALAGVPNRKAFDEKLKMALGAWRRESRRFVLALMDVDHFKWINDTHGHQAGDRVVTNVGAFLKKCVRDNDFVSRYGGDEFAVIFDNVDLSVASEVAERIRASVSKQNFGVQLHTDEAAVTFSIGLAAPWEGAGLEEMLQRADQALYGAKEAGRNKVYCFQETKEEAVAVTGA